MLTILPFAGSIVQDDGRMTLTPLVAGPLTMMFDSSNAFLRYVRLGDQELIRGVFAAVRDHNWDTVPFSIDEVQVEQTVDSFSVSFVANSLNSEIAFAWQGIIEGSSDGVVQYHFRGTAEAPFFRNRIGLCVLHPSCVCAGKPCCIEHVDGTSTQGEFPKLISPYQPFRNVRSISHHVVPKVQVRVTMTGDTFETEDQRNWTDASYKTYSTPLEIPFPVLVEPVNSIEQSVVIELIKTESMAFGTSNRQRKTIEPKTHQMDFDWDQPILRPRLGFAWPSGHRFPIHKTASDRLIAMRPDHLRFDLWLNQENWRSDLAIAMDVTQSINTKAELALFVESTVSHDWRECMHLLSTLQTWITRVLLFHTNSNSTSSEMVRSVSKSLKDASTDVQIVVGTNAYFAELNRGRPSLVSGCKVCYSMNPQVHAFDNLSLAETLEAQRATVDSAVSVFNTDVVISPVTFRPRFNPNATSLLDSESQLASAIDTRQTDGYGGAWTAGVFANLMTHPRVHSITLFEAFGPRGIMEIDGREYPMTNPIQHVLASEQLFTGRSSCPLELVAFGTQSANGKRHAVFGNLSDRELAVGFRTTRQFERIVPVAAESVKIVLMEEAAYA